MMENEKVNGEEKRDGNWRRIDGIQGKEMYYREGEMNMLMGNAAQYCDGLCVYPGLGREADEKLR